MGSLAGKSPASTYKSLLKVVDETNGVSSLISRIEDGEGTASCLYISDDQLQILPQNDDTTTAFQVKNTSGARLLIVDTTNNLVKTGTTATPANTQILEYTAQGLVPAAGTHYFVTKGTGQYVTLNGIPELTNGTGTDPETTYSGGATTDDLITNLFLVPINLTIDAVKFMVSTTTDTDTTINVHLYSYDIKNVGATNDGLLTNGTLLANGQATSVDRNVIKTVDCSIDSSSVSAGEVIACFVENETNTDSIMLQTQVLYHFN